MDLPSMESASAVTVYLFAIVVVCAVAALVVALILRRVLPRSHGEAKNSLGDTVGPLGVLSRVVIEYVGNTSWRESPLVGIQERRHNRASRVLMDHVRGEAVARDASPSEVEQLVEELRQAIRSAERVD